eukprot:m.239941 g.239941  ORF g.239941 m.239941 type:complete len:149 (+) comp14302_c0_seq1:202-648(+)
MFSLRQAVKSSTSVSRALHNARITFGNIDEKLKEIQASNDPKTKAEGVTGRIPDNYEQATGLEREELLAMAQGNDDPFGLEGIKWGPAGTKAAPRMIPSHFDSRIVGCNCDPESEIIKYFNVNTGDAQPCPCGQQYFQLEKVTEKVTW